MLIRLVGLVAAAGAGAAQVCSHMSFPWHALLKLVCFQPLLSILFGNLTKDFVEFATVLTLAKQGDQEAAARIPEVADSFRRVAAKDASYLVYIGQCLTIPNGHSSLNCDSAYRSWYLCLHIRLHVYLGRDRRTQCETRSREISGSYSASRGRVL